MPITKRIEVASSPQGSSVLAALTPTEFAELFPRYYQRGLPDVGGFRAATTAAAQKRQSEASASILDRLTKAEQGAEAYASQIYHKLKRKLGLETEKQPELSKEADDAFAKVRSGPIAVSSDEGKVFSRLDDKKLESVGIKRTKDNTGRDVYQYTQPQVSVEEAKSRLKTSTSTGQMMKDVYNSFISAGFSPQQAKALTAEAGRENDFRANKIFGTHAEPGGGAGTHGRENIGIFSWGDPKRHAEFVNFMRENGGYDENGQLKRDQNTLILQAKFVKKEMANYNDASRAFLADREVSRDQGGKYLASYIGWDIAGKYINPQEHINKRNGYYAKVDSFAGSEDGAGPNKEYTGPQIDKMMEQLREEKNASRKQVLANILSDAGVSTATINSISQVKTSGVTGEHFGDRKECVSLSKYFAPQIGPASKWQFNEGTAGIVPGAVIATRSYGHGPTPGGARFDQMPDKKSHYHTGIALTRPNAAGDVLIFDQAQGYGSKITKVNIKNYHGETWGVVKGGEPTPKSMEAVNIALSRANDSEKAAITESMRGSAPKTATSTGEIKAVTDTGPPPVKPVDQEGNPIPPQQQAPVKQPGAPQEPAPQVKADAPPPAPQPKTVTFRLNKGKYLDQIEGKYGSLLNAPIVGPGREGAWQQTLDGINEKGVKFKQTKDGIEITLPESDTRISEVRSEMKNRGLDEKTFLQSQINEPKVEAKKAEVPTPPPPTPTPPTPEQAQTEPATIKKFVKGDGYAGMVDVPNPKYVAPKAETPPPPEQPKVEAKPQEPPKVPGASDGGLFNVGDRNVAISPMDKRDDKAVIDTKTQQPLFTVKSGEKINVTPQQKVDGIAPAQDNIRNEINALRQEMGNSFADAGGRMTPIQMTQIRSAATDNPNFVNNLTKQNVDLWNNPVMERAMNRTRLQETGDSLNNHFSYGNTNG